VIHAIDVPPQLLGNAPEGFGPLPMMGPQLVGVRSFKDEGEKYEATLAALQGWHLGAHPDFWIPHDQAISMVLSESKLAAVLIGQKH